jgi:hypothetical protein
MEIKITSQQCANESGNVRRFHYFLTVDQVRSGPFFCEDYGIRIAEDDGISVAIPSITTSATRIDELMTLLVDHQVGPAGLEDVLSDWL